MLKYIMISFEYNECIFLFSDHLAVHLQAAGILHVVRKLRKIKSIGVQEVQKDNQS